jgi:hypothetical protein
VTRLASVEERKQLADRIAAAPAVRAAPAPDPDQPIPSREPSLETIGVDLADALKEAIPFLAYCYKDADASPDRTVSVRMTLNGDRDVGTLIDPDQLVDKDGTPRATKLEGCLRRTLESLALPPLAQGDRLKIPYSFKFR